MSRFRKVVHSVGSSYVLLGANVLFTVGSVRLSLSHLSTEQFGLWNVIMQLAGFLTLLELGISPAVTRALFDYKDQPEHGEYGRVIQTGFFILIAQGLLVLLLGIALTPALSDALRIPSTLAPEFIRWMRWQCVITAAGFGTRIFGQLLITRHRYDIGNYGQAFAFGVNLACLWLFYRMGWKLASLVASNAIVWALNSFITIAACLRLEVFPSRQAWGRPTWRQLREMLAFGKDAFLISLGWQLIQASQTVIVTRALGLQAAAIWAVCTKMYVLVSQLVWRIYDSSASAFAEMIVRSEQARLLDRFKVVVILSASLSAVLAVVFAATNEPFVVLWTQGKLGWSNYNNVLLAVWLIIVSIARCLNGHALLTKEIRALRYIYFIEGVLIFAAGFFAARLGGFPAMLLLSILCSVAVSGAYGMHRSKEYFRVSLREILAGWLRPMAKVALWLVPWATLVWFALKGLPPLWRLAGGGLMVGLPGIFLLLRVGLPPSVQIEIARRAPGRLNPVLRKIFAV